MHKLFLPLFGLLFLCTGCTLSFQNISTHGKADDVVDQNLKNDPDVDASLDVPEDLL